MRWNVIYDGLQKAQLDYEFMISLLDVELLINQNLVLPNGNVVTFSACVKFSYKPN